jgi:hypothetical protein
MVSKGYPAGTVTGVMLARPGRTTRGGSRQSQRNF